MLHCNHCGDPSINLYGVGNGLCPSCASNNKTYIFHADPGHGWLAVRRHELIRLDILTKVSAHSYQKDDMVYLEEDCDAGLFCKAKEAEGETFKVKEEHKENTPIRNYHFFQL